MSLARRASPSPAPRAIARWLLVVAAFVFLMVVIGGITRLTESGLSMTRWEPISGAVPPLNAMQWNAEFDAYKATPEYRKINRGMTLSGFKSIFFWEYLHRLVGRLIGLVFALPLAWFAWQRRIPRGYGPRLVAVLALGGLQGTIGWWMVASGLVNRPDVSHYRLAVHLITALFIFSGLIWTALDLLRGDRVESARPALLRGLPLAALLVLAVQLMMGAFTAGLDAGYAFAEWPTMGGHFFPEGVPLIAPLWRNVIDQPIVVQFVHRWFAWIVALMAVLVSWRARKHGLPGRAAAILIAVVAQIMLGIATLLSGVAIPIAAAHQACAALLLASLVWAAHGLGSRR